MRIVVQDQKAGVHHRFPYQRNIIEHIGGLIDTCGGVDIASERSPDALKPVKDALLREVLGTIEAHVLKEVRETILVGSLLNRSDVGRKVEFRPARRLVIVSDVIGQTVLQLADLDRRVIRKLLHLSLSDERRSGQHKGRDENQKFFHNQLYIRIIIVHRNIQGHLRAGTPKPGRSPPTWKT